MEHRGAKARRRAGRLRRRRQGRRPRHPGAPGLLLPWPGLQHRHGPGAVRPHQSVRLRRPAGGVHGRPGRSRWPGSGETGAAARAGVPARPAAAGRRCDNGGMSAPTSKAIPITTLEPGARQVAGDKIARSPVQFADAPVLRKPSWIRVRIPSGNNVARLKEKLRANRLVTVCEEASCPNIHECFGHGTATFMILGEGCTRRCSFCDVAHGRPKPPDPAEPLHLAQTVKDMGLKYVVVTSVDRDDLRDGGAGHFVDCISAIREMSPGTKIEILTPDFRGKGRMERALEILAADPPDVFNHNIETVPDLYRN